MNILFNTVRTLGVLHLILPALGSHANKFGSLESEWQIFSYMLLVFLLDVIVLIYILTHLKSCYTAIAENWQKFSLLRKFLEVFFIITYLLPFVSIAYILIF